VDSRGWDATGVAPITHFPDIAVSAGEVLSGLVLAV
jgi:hypothetical protein